MENYNEINQKIAKNLIYYRKAAGLTQAELAEKINYSDKSISKWELGNGVPDVYILMQLAKLYHITLNDLVDEPSIEKVKQVQKTHGLKLLIILLSTGIVWLVATCLFAGFKFLPTRFTAWWIIFIYAVVVNAIIVIVYACIWRYRILNFIAISTLIWTTLTSAFLTVTLILRMDGQTLNSFWCIYLVGVPLQVLEILWSFYRTLFYRNKRKRTVKPPQEVEE